MRRGARWAASPTSGRSSRLATPRRRLRPRVAQASQAQERTSTLGGLLGTPPVAGQIDTDDGEAAEAGRASRNSRKEGGRQGLLEGWSGGSAHWQRADSTYGGRVRHECEMTGGGEQPGWIRSGMTEEQHTEETTEQTEQTPTEAGPYRAFTTKEELDKFRRSRLAAP